MVERNHEHEKESSSFLEPLLKKIRKIFSNDHSTNEEKPLSMYLSEIEKISREVDFGEQSDDSLEFPAEVEKNPQENNQVLSKVLNEVFRIGEPIDVFDGETQIGQTGTFLYANEKFLLWINHNEEIAIQLLEGTVCFQTAKSVKPKEHPEPVIEEQKKKPELDELMAKMMSMRDQMVEKNN